MIDWTKKIQICYNVIKTSTIAKQRSAVKHPKQNAVGVTAVHNNDELIKIRKNG